MADDATQWALAIEMSNPSSHDDPPAASIAAGRLGKDANLVDLQELPLAPGSRHDDGLMPAIESLRSQLGVEQKDLARVCVSIGPGGYTGLRIAVSTAKLISEATGALPVGVPSAAVVAANAGCTPPFAVCLASKRGTTHVTVFDDLTFPPTGRAVGLIDDRDLESIRVRTLIADSFLPDSIRLRANDLGMSLLPPRFSASSCLRIGLVLDPGDSSVLSPVYARDPEAVRLWQSRRPE